MKERRTEPERGEERGGIILKGLEVTPPLSPHPPPTHTHTHIEVISSTHTHLCVSGGDGYWMGSVGLVALVSDFSLLIAPSFFFFIVCLLNERGGVTGPVIDSYILLSRCSSLCRCEDSPLSVLYLTLNDKSFLISCFCCGSSGVCQSVSQSSCCS